MFRKMPFILLAMIFAVLLLDPMLPLTIKQGIYSTSLSIKSVIILLLPFIIFGLLFKAAVMLANNATKIIGFILLFVCASNLWSTFLSHYFGIWIYSFNMSMVSPEETSGLKALWSLNLPTLISNDKAMFSGIILGIILMKFYPKSSKRVALSLERVINRILKGIVCIIPLFVAGFVVKLQYDGVMWTIVKDYTTIFGIIACAQFGYIGLVYFILSKGRLKPFWVSIRNMLPAAISGFSTMSSAASMPLTIVGAENNAQNKDLAASVVPATVNIHLVGDCFAIPILAYAVLKSFGLAEPSFMQYMVFSGYFVLAKFSVAAIPGGGILVMLPILEKYLGFHADMMSLITALYILFDPIITSANVLGNGAFAKLMDKCLGHRVKT